MHLVAKLPEDLLRAVLSRLPRDERISDQIVSKRWKDALRDPSTWITLDLRDVCLDSAGELLKVLRFMALALPAAAPSTSRLRFLGMSLSHAHFDGYTTLADIGLHPSAAKVEQLASRR